MNISDLIPSRFRPNHSSLCQGYFESPSIREMGKDRELAALLKSGDEVDVQISLSTAGEGDEVVVISTIRDITAIREAEAELTYQASHDSLTGLLNRVELERQLTLVIKNAQRNGKHSNILFFIDLDQFKIVNDTSGHIAGDELLRQISDLLSSHMRSSDVLARLGGDEFAVLMKYTETKYGLKKAQAIISAIAGYRFSWLDKVFTIGASIGIVVLGENVASAVDALKYADIACYAAKDFGRNRAYVYHPEDKLLEEKGSIRRAHVISDALIKDKFVLFVQKIEATSVKEKKNYYEVLIRLELDDNNLIPPSTFLPSAERYNLICNLDVWVINHIFLWIEQYADQVVAKNLCFSINLSGPSIGNTVVLKTIQKWFEKEIVSPERINFEITETAAITHLRTAKKFIESITDYGSTFSLDDFGSGLSSFEYLKNLDVHSLKIDGSFVRDMLKDPFDAAMVDSINTLGHVMGVKTIAEFVESDLIAEKLKDLGLDYLQGFAIHKPMPIDLLIQTK